MKPFAPLLALTLLGLAAPAQAQDAPRRVIEVGSPDFRPLALAIPDVRPIGSSPAVAKVAQAITTALRFDFDLAAQFEVLDPKSYLADPAKEGMTAAFINFGDWVNVGAVGLIKGAARDAGGKVSVELRFFDVASERSTLSKTFTVAADEGRVAGHTFADELVEKMTGGKGIFRTRIAMVKKTPKGRELYMMDLDGENLRAVTNNGSLNLLPSWTPDGRGLVFTSYLRHNPNLYRLDLASSQLTLLSNERGLNTGGATSANGGQIALTLSRDGNSEIYTMNADRTGLRRLTKEWAIDSSPSWSPDGKQIAFTSARLGNPQIFVMGADGSSPSRMTYKGTYNTTPDWSPRGDLIAFTARDERNVFDIFVIEVATKEIRRLTQDQGHNEEPSFSPDGNHIVFTSTREGRSQVWVMAIDGSNQRRITSAGGFTTPAWSPR